MKRLAIIGAGWAGLAAGVRATQAGHQVSVFEAAAQVGGRARNLALDTDSGASWVLDNGQHILIGAYTRTLALMREVGVDPDTALLRLPLTLRTPAGLGLQLPDWPAPFDLLWGVLGAQGWGWRDKRALLSTALGWRRQHFQCDAHLSVAELCRGLSPAVMQLLIEPLCVSALNTPADRASAHVFLRVLYDALFEVKGGSRLLLPLLPLGDLLAVPAVTWLRQRGATVQCAHRVREISMSTGASPTGPGWRVDGQAFDQVLLACSATDAVRLVGDTAAQATHAACREPLLAWCDIARALRFEAIATVYVRAPSAAAVLPWPMMALPSSPQQPAQFVFDRSRLHGPPGLLAFVISASQGDRETLTAQVLAQCRDQLGLRDLQVLQTVVEKRATFACTPGLQRPPSQLAAGLMACGDYVEGPYPATLEGAVRSAEAAVLAM